MTDDPNFASGPHDLVLAELAAIHADTERRINLQPRSTVTPSTVGAARPDGGEVPDPPQAGPDRHGTTHAVTEARVERVSDDGC